MRIPSLQLTTTLARFPQAPCQPRSTTHLTHCGLLHPTAGTLVPMRQGTPNSTCQAVTEAETRVMIGFLGREEIL